MVDVCDDSDWQSLVCRLGGAIDIEGSARASGAIQRARQVRSGSDLLRLALAYGPGGQSLRETAGWASVQGIASLSDVALLKRLRGAADWLEQVVGALLAQRAGVSPARADAELRLLITDGSVISGPASRIGFRLHAVFDMASQRFSQLDLTDTKGGESLMRVTAGSGDLVLADRGFPHPQGLAHLRATGAHFLVRVGRRSLALCEADGSAFDLATALDVSDQTGGDDRAVQVVDARRGSERPPLPARLVVLRKPPEAAEQARSRALRESRRGGHTNDPLALRAAEHLMLITSLPPERASPERLFALYRVRWQIELAFKRLKSLLHIGGLPAKDPALARAWICAHLIVALMTDDLVPALRDVFPPGLEEAVPLGHG